MKPQQYTLNEVISTLRTIAQEEDSITNLLKSGHFRFQFEEHVTKLRAAHTKHTVEALTDRLVSIVINNTPVYILDDIQGALSKKQFALFLRFLHVRSIPIALEGAVYIGVPLVEAFVDLYEEEQNIKRMKEELSVVKLA